MEVQTYRKRDAIILTVTDGISFVGYCDVRIDRQTHIAVVGTLWGSIQSAGAMLDAMQPELERMGAEAVVTVMNHASAKWMLDSLLRRGYECVDMSPDGRHVFEKRLPHMPRNRIAFLVGGGPEEPGELDTF